MAAAKANGNISHKMRIQRNLTNLTANTVNLFQLTMKLIETSTLTPLEVEEINSCKTEFERCTELYIKLYKKDETAFENLCAALGETQNEVVLSKLKNNSIHELDGSDSSIVLSGANIPGSMMMKFYQRRNIFKHFDFITESTANLLEVLVHLEEVGVLSLDEHQKILSWKSTTSKNAALYITLLNKKPNPFVKLIKVLRETNNGIIADKLESISDPNENFEDQVTNIRMAISRIRIDEEELIKCSVADNIWFGIREILPKERFIGRDDISIKLHESLKSQEIEAKSNNCSKFTVLCGLPGIGKSETVRQYVGAYHNKNNVIWINAENMGSMHDSFSQLARDDLHIDLMDVNGHEKDIQRIIREVYDYLSDRCCIFIFDNAENKEEFRNENSIDRFLPILQPSHRRPFVIVTSQNKHWPSQAQIFDTIEMDVFTRMESATFIKERLNINLTNKEDYVENLSLTMKGHPLALTQAAEYISRENQFRQNDGSTYDIADFLKDFDEKEKEILDHNPYIRSHEAHNPHLVTIFATFKLSVDGIRKTEDSGEKAIEIFNIMAFYDSYGIRSKLFHPYISDRRKLGMILGILQRYSLISCSDGVVDVHGLFQQVGRLELQEQKKYENILEISLELLDCFMPRDVQSVLKGDEIAVPHAQVAWEYAINFPHFICKYHDDLGLVIMEGIRNGCYSRALRFSDEAILHLSDEFGATNDQVMKMRAINLLSHIRIGNEDSMTKQLDIMLQASRQSKSGSNAKNVALNFLKKYSTISGSTFQQRESSKEVLAKMTDALSQENNDSEEDDIFSIGALQLVQAGLLQQEGNHAEALKIVETVQKGIEKVLNYSDPFVLYTKKALAGVMSSLGKTDEALQLLEHVHSIENSKGTQSENSERKYMKLLPNIDKVFTKQMEADIYSNAGKYDEALQVLGYTPSTSTADSSSILPNVPNKKPSIPANINPDTLQSYTLMAKNLISQGKYTEALQIAEENYSLSLEKFGAANATTISLACVLIWALDRLERFDEALDKSQILFETLSANFGDENEITQSILLMIPELIEKRDKQHLVNVSPTNS